MFVLSVGVLLAPEQLKIARSAGGSFKTSVSRPVGRTTGCTVHSCTCDCSHGSACSFHVATFVDQDVVLVDSQILAEQNIARVRVPYGNCVSGIADPKTPLRCSLQIPSATTTGISGQRRPFSQSGEPCAHRVQTGSDNRDCPTSSSKGSDFPESKSKNHLR